MKSLEGYKFHIMMLLAIGKLVWDWYNGVIDADTMMTGVWAAGVCSSLKSFLNRLLAKVKPR